MPRWRWLVPALLVLGWLVVAGVAGPYAGRVGEVQENNNAAYLPSEAEATQVNDLLTEFEDQEVTPAVVVYAREGGLRASDLAEVAADAAQITEEMADQLAGELIGPIPSDDGEALQLIVPFAGSDSDVLIDRVDRLRELAQDTDGLTAHVTGQGGLLVDLVEVFGEVDSFLILVTASVVLVLLVLIYRSPFLPLVVLGCAGLALSLANAVVYLLAREDLVTLSGQTQGILNVLVLGAATDYALLIVARFREELRRHPNRFDAMRRAHRASVPPIAASGGTVVLGMLCLLFSEMAGNRSLGPIAATGIVCALLVMLTLLPAVLVLCGRFVFWPFRPRYGSDVYRGPGIWGRIAALVDRRPRLIWVVTALVLGLATIGVVRLDANGIPQSEVFLTEVDSAAGQDVLTEHYPGGSGSPAIVIADADRLDEVVRTAAGIDGVESVAPYPPGAPNPTVVDGLVRVDVTLSDAADSPEAAATVRQLRAELHAIDGARAKVGGFTAVDIDTQDTSRRDRNVIIPLVLMVVLLILIVLLRALVAPVLLIATVLLSFFATMGVAGLVFRDLLGWPGTDSSVPLYAFVFLVALGVDYNIFLMTRVREEAVRRGTRKGTLVGLAVTGGVITSAGAVLAATFSALAVLPLMFLAQIAFMVSFGVLLDTLVVRSLLVPALTVDIGRTVWWPSALARSTP